MSFYSKVNGFVVLAYLLDYKQVAICRILHCKRRQIKSWKVSFYIIKRHLLQWETTAYNFQYKITIKQALNARW